MKRFIRPEIVPIGGFEYTDPNDGFKYNQGYRTFDDLEKHIIRRRNQNGYHRIENLRAVWEHYVCANNPAMSVKCCEVAKNISRRFSQYWKGAQSYVKALVGGADSFVRQEVADKRASRCLDCTENVKNAGHSMGQLYTNKWVEGQVGNRKSKHDKELFTCNQCSCILKSKVFFSDEIVKESLTAKDIGNLTLYPKNVRNGRKMKCWQLDTLDKE